VNKRNALGMHELNAAKKVASFFKSIPKIFGKRQDYR